MLGTGREEILECEERYGQWKEGEKAAWEKGWTRTYSLDVLRVTTPYGREDRE